MVETFQEDINTISISLPGISHDTCNLIASPRPQKTTFTWSNSSRSRIPSKVAIDNRSRTVADISAILFSIFERFVFCEHKLQFCCCNLHSSSRVWLPSICENHTLINYSLHNGYARPKDNQVFSPSMLNLDLYMVNVLLVPRRRDDRIKAVAWPLQHPGSPEGRQS